MKISKLFHWLYGAVMFLPLLVAPIFGIYSHRHTIDSYSVDVSLNLVVDFNQQINNTSSSWYPNYYSFVDGTYNVSSSDNDALVRLQQSQNYSIGHKILYSVDVLNNDESQQTLYFGSYGIDSVVEGNRIVPYATSWSNYSFIAYSNTPSTFSFIIGRNSRGAFSFSFTNFMAFDLTQMFGVGNEPTISQFKSWYLDSYYEYTLSDIQLLHNYSTETYNYTDIGSQFLYSLYITTDKYLNFDNVFNLYQVYDWMELNVFEGNAPFVFTIVWHYLDYWLLLSIFWLCFDVLIYVPLLAHRWLDKAALE